MAEFHSNEVEITVNPLKIYHYLNDFNNFNQLLPPQVTNWKSTGETCSFTVQGMADIALRIADRAEPSFISYAAIDDQPFAMTLNTHVRQVDDSISIVNIILSAKLNPMLKMMASRPLQNLVNILADKLKEEMEG
jgi:carbon monoxide dehydrogenase subunit G